MYNTPQHPNHKWLKIYKWITPQWQKNVNSQWKVLNEYMQGWHQQKAVKWSFTCVERNLCTGPVPLTLLQCPFLSLRKNNVLPSLFSRTIPPHPLPQPVFLELDWAQAMLELPAGSERSPIGTPLLTSPCWDSVSSLTWLYYVCVQCSSTSSKSRRGEIWDKEQPAGRAAWDREQ